MRITGKENRRALNRENRPVAMIATVAFWATLLASV
jgi:hypothetical protein